MIKSIINTYRCLCSPSYFLKDDDIKEIIIFKLESERGQIYKMVTN